MSPVDPSTLDSGTPRTEDGRTYPEHLRAYEQYDEVFLPVLAARDEATFDDLSIAVDDARMRSALPRWLASAGWRMLVQRVDDSFRGPRRYRLTERGEQFSHS